MNRNKCINVMYLMNMIFRDYAGQELMVGTMVNYMRILIPLFSWVRRVFHHRGGRVTVYLVPS